MDIDTDQIHLLEQENYLSLHEANLFCDINIYNKWQVGRIIKLTGDYVYVKYYESSTLPDEKIHLSSNRISHYRKYTKPESSSYRHHNSQSHYSLEKVISIMQDIIKTKFDNDNMQPYKIIQLYRGEVYYYFDVLFHLSLDSKEIPISFQGIELFIDFLSNYFLFLNENKEYIKLYEQNKSSMLINWKCAFVSFQEEAVQLLKRIFMFDVYYLDYYSQYDAQLMKIVVNKYIQIKEKPKVVSNDSNDMVIVNNNDFIKISQNYWYDTTKRLDIKGATNDIHAIIYSYFSDYFYSLKGHKYIFSLLNSKETSIPFLFIKLYLDAIKCVTLGVDTYKNIFLDEKRFLKETIYSRINSMNDIDIKETPKEIIWQIIQKLINLLKLDPDTADYLTLDMILTYFFRCFISKTLEKQISAINFINLLIDHVKLKEIENNPKAPFTDNDIYIKNVNDSSLVSFFKDKKMIDVILAEGVHEEIIKRCHQVVILMYKYHWGLKDNIDAYSQLIFNSLWRYVNDKHTGVSPIVEELINDMIEYASIQDKLYLYDKIKTLIGLSVIVSKADLILLKNFTEKTLLGNQSVKKEMEIAINSNQSLIDFNKDTKLDEDSLFGLAKLWEYMQDSYFDSAFSDNNNPIKNSEVASIIIQQCIDHIIFLLHNKLLLINESTRQQFLYLALYNITKGTSCVQSLIFIKKLLSSEDYQPCYIRLLKNTNKLESLNIECIVNSIVKDLKRYIDKVDSYSLELQYKEKKEYIFEGYFPYFINIQIRLESIMSISSKTKGLQFSFENFFDLWQICHHSQNNVLLYQIIYSNISNIDYILLNDFFEKILLSNEAFAINSTDSFKLFQKTFFEVNTRSKKLLPIYNSFRVNITMNTDIIGLSKLWSLLKEINNESIQNQIASMLCDICLKTKSYDEIALTFWSHFISQLIQEMENANNTKDENAINGLLKLIKLIFESIDDPGIISQTKDDSYIKSSFSAYSFYYKDKEMNLTLTIGENEPFYSVRYRLSHYFQIPTNNIKLIKDQKCYDLNNDFDFFRNILSSDSVIVIKNDKHPILLQKKNPKALILNQQAFLSTMFALLYDQKRSYIPNVWKLLKDWPENDEIKNIIKDLATANINKNNDNSKEIAEYLTDSTRELSTKFQRENIYYISLILYYIKVIIPNESKEWILLFSKASLIKKIKDIFIDITLREMNMIEEYDALTDIIFIIDSILIYETNDEYKELILKKILILISEIFDVDIDKQHQSKMYYHKILIKEAEMIGLLLSMIKKYSLIDKFIDMVTGEQSELFISIITKGLIESMNNKVKEQLLQIILSIIENKQLILQQKTKLLQFIIEVMLNKDNIQMVIKHIEKKEKIIEENYYFTFLSSLLNNGYEMIAYNFEELALTLLSLIDTQTHVSGYLSILYIIVIHSKEITQSLIKNHNIYDLIYDKCLFSKSCKEPLIKKAPKCLTESSKKIPYQLLVVLLLYNNTNEEFEKDVFKNLNKFHSLSKWRTSQIFNWKMCLSENKKNTFVGIKNLGCTCYMNSIFQLFYMIPDLRESILASECKIETQNSLYELKKIMASLKLYESQYCDAEDFCKNADDRVLDVREQMDIDEFFVFLIEKLENHLKSTSNDDLIKYFFHGKNCDELIFKDGCSHNRENDLSFYSMQLQVKNKRSIYESLDALIEGELMEGDNAIFCQDCDKKMSAIKRQSFKVLPRILSFVLKRFEFDYTNMKKIKVNDYYEFPIELDMAKYTLDYLRNGTYTGSAIYTLKDVVIHSGHSEGGHYYSFIKDYKGDNWYEFNDINIRKFNINDINLEAFGGKEMIYNQNINKPEEIEKKRNAYVLFYEKVDRSDCEQYSKVKIKTEDENNNHVPNEIIEKINQDMSIYWVQKTIFDKSYHNFILELVTNYVNTSFKPNEFLIFCNFLSRNNNNGNISHELSLLRDNYKPISSNLESYITQSEIKIYEAFEQKKIDYVDIFSFFCNFFFNVLIRSKNKTLIAPSVDLIKFCINYNEQCAIWILDEFCNYETLIEYLIDNPFYEIKKLIVGIIYCAMLKLSNDQELKGNEYLKNVANHYVNFISDNMEKENNFLYFILYRFGQLDLTLLDYISIQIPFLDFLLQFRKYKRNKLEEALDYANRSRGKVRCMITAPSHAVLSTTKSLFNQDRKIEEEDTYAKNVKQKEKNKTAAMFRSENYQLMLICLLMTNKNIKMNTLFKLFSDTEFMMSLLEDVKNKQSAYAVSNLFIHICTNQKGMTESINILLLKMINSLESDDIEYIMLIFKRFLVKINDENNDNRIKSSLDGYIKVVMKRCNKFIYMSFHINFVIKIFAYEKAKRLIDYFKDTINKFIDWTNEALKVLNQNEQQNVNHKIYMARVLDMKSKLMNIIKPSQTKQSSYDSDLDLTDFKFCIGDIVSYE